MAAEDAKVWETLDSDPAPLRTVQQVEDDYFSKQCVKAAEALDGSVIVLEDDGQIE
jgi:uncharacterized caspase-like protein